MYISQSVVTVPGIRRMYTSQYVVTVPVTVPGLRGMYKSVRGYGAGTRRMYTSQYVVTVPGIRRMYTSQYVVTVPRLRCRDKEECISQYVFYGAGYGDGNKRIC